jgi:hypothetical protein
MTPDQLAHEARQFDKQDRRFGYAVAFIAGVIAGLLLSILGWVLSGGAS